MTVKNPVHRTEKPRRLFVFLAIMFPLSCGIAAGCLSWSAHESRAFRDTQRLTALVSHLSPVPSPGFDWTGLDGVRIRIFPQSNATAMPSTSYWKHPDGFLSCSLVREDILGASSPTPLIVQVSVPLSDGVLASFLWFIFSATFVAGFFSVWLFSARRFTGQVSAQIDAVLRTAPFFGLGGGASLSSPSVGFSDFAALRRGLRRLFRKMDKEIAQAEGKAHSLQLMVDSMKEGILVVDRQCRIRAINPSAIDFFGLDTTDVMSFDGVPLLEKIRSTELHALWESIMENRNPAEMELILYRLVPTTLHVSASWLHSPRNSDEGVLFVMSDISTLKHLEAVRTEFVANVSHELRTPVTALKGFAETLLDGGLTDPGSARHFVEIILRQAERLQAIIDDLLMLSRLEQSGGKIPRETGSLLEIVDNALEVCRGAAIKRAITIAVQIPAIEIYMNRHLLEQAIINLVDNAVKYSPEESLVRIQAGKDNAGWWLTVTDNGPGIPLRDQERLFERFYRIDRARSRNMGGTGLGLSIVRHIALVHGGSVSLESTAGQGSRFTLRFS